MDGGADGRRRRLAVALALLVVAGCGNGGGQADIPFDPMPTAGPTSPVGTTATTVPGTSPATAAPVTSEWVAAAANLEGLSSECGNMSYVTTRPDKDVVIAGVALQGLWASEDGAEEWTHMGEGAGSAEITNRPSAIIFDPDRPERFWESGTYLGPGGFRTDDDGKTFVALGNLANTDLLAVDLSDPDRQTMLSGKHERGELYRSTDGGSTWVDITTSLPADVGYTTSPHVVDATTHLLGTSNSAGSGIFRTTDGGESWTRVFEVGVSGRPLVRADGSIWWLVAQGGGLITSTDDGKTWTVATPGGAFAANAAHLLELPDGSLAALGGGYVVVSADDGDTWKPVGPALPYAPTGLAYSSFRETYYVWRFDCSFENDNSIPADAIMRLDLRESPPG